MVWEKVRSVHEGWKKNGDGARIPIWEEGDKKGVIGEVYCMYHLPSTKVYVGMSYHGAMERFRTHWGQGIWTMILAII